MRGPDADEWDIAADDERLDLGTAFTDGKRALEHAPRDAVPEDAIVRRSVGVCTEKRDKNGTLAKKKFRYGRPRQHGDCRPEPRLVCAADGRGGGLRQLVPGPAAAPGRRASSARRHVTGVAAPGSSCFLYFFSRLLYLTKNFDVVCIFSSRSVFFVFFAMARSGLGEKMDYFLLCARRRGPVRACLGAATTARVRSLSPEKKTNSSLAREGSG